METRGVASVRSPVCNLQQQYGHVKHESFVEAVVDAFREEYDVHEEVRLAILQFATFGTTDMDATQVQVVNDSDGTRHIEYIQHGMKELKVSTRSA